MTDALSELLTPITCTNCRFCDWPSFATGQPAVIEATAFCFNPHVMAETSHVTGTGNAKLCLVTRSTGACGPQAKLYAAKERRP